MPNGETMSFTDPNEHVRLHQVRRGCDVIVGGRRVPILEGFDVDGGKILLVFDRRLSVEVPVAQFDAVAAFIADVMESVMNPDCGRTFNRVVEITGTANVPGEAGR
jgi:hypothetical protein